MQELWQMCHQNQFNCPLLSHYKDSGNELTFAKYYDLIRIEICHKELFKEAKSPLCFRFMCHYI